MNPHLIQYMKIGHYRLGILCPKYEDLALTERDIHLLLIEWIIPSTVAFCQAVEEPLGKKSWYICRAAGGNDDRCSCLNLLANIVRDYDFTYWHNVSLILHRPYLQHRYLLCYLLVSKNSLQSFDFLQDNIFLCEILYLLR